MARNPIATPPVSGTGGTLVDGEDFGNPSGPRRETDQIGGSGIGEIAEVRNAAPSAADYGLIVRPIPGNEVAGVGIGAASDAASIGSGSVIGMLKRIRDLLNLGLPALVGGLLPVSVAGQTITVTGSVAVTELPNEGQQLAANSISVVLASNQPAVPVTIGATVTVTGTVVATATDFDIRNLTAALDTVKVEAGAAPLDVQGTVSTKTPLTPAAPQQYTVGVADAEYVAANAARRGLYLRNESTSGQVIALAFGQAAELGKGVNLRPNEPYELDEHNFHQASVHAISSAANGFLAAQEYAP